MSQTQNETNIDITENQEETSTSNTSQSEGNINRASNVRSQGIGDRLNNVLRDIRPIVEHARMGNHARLSLPTWVPWNTPRIPPGDMSNINQRPLSTVTHVNLGPNSQSFVLIEQQQPPLLQRSLSLQPALNSSTSADSNFSNQTQDDINISVNPGHHENNTSENNMNDNNSEELNQQALDMCAFINVLLQYSPFFTILLLKLMYDCREGLFAFVLLWSAFYHSNSLVKRECGKQASRSLIALFFEFGYTISLVLLVHVLFGHDRLLSNIIMFPGYTQPIDVWELLWLVTLTDLMLKILTVDVKILVTATPAVVLPFQKRGKVYLFIESVSQLYRCLLPIQPWLYYLMQSYQGSEKMVGMFLATAYVVAKVIEVIIRLKLFKNATWTLLQSVNLGTKPTGEQMSSAGDNCPICHDDFTTPVRLGCSHIFCELCITAWLDREHTCPLCRAKVQDEPTWRDGSTTHYFQLY